MKHLTLLITFVFLTFFEVVQAQKFVGGSMGFNTSGGSTSSGNVSVDKPRTTSFSFSPFAGYFLSSNLAVGAGINYVSDRTKTPGNPDVIDVSRTFGLTPFVRYYALRINKFAVFGRGYLGLSWTSQHTTSGSNTVKGPRTTTFGLGVVPGLSYDLSSKVAFEATINILNFGYNLSVTKNLPANTKDVTSNFNFGAGLNNIVNTGSLVIGAIFKLQ